jgi:hypothetical protein
MAVDRQYGSEDLRLVHRQRPSVSLPGLPMPPDVTLTVRVSFAYVLIIQWLRDDEPQTGEELHAELKRMGVPSILCRCKNSMQVWRAIVDATKRIHELGIPAVHIEAHGVEMPEDSEEEPRFTGADGPPLTWSEVGNWLAPINDASGHRMLLVGATCWGQGAIATMNIFSHCAPFAVCVGFSTEVSSKSLRAAMVLLYWGIAVKGYPFPDALDAANRELYNTNEKLERELALSLGYKLLREMRRQLAHPDQVPAMIGRMRARFEAAKIEVPPGFDETTPEVVAHVLQERTQQVWDMWFPIDLQRRNSTYRLDWSLLDP